MQHTINSGYIDVGDFMVNYVGEKISTNIGLPQYLKLVTIKKLSPISANNIQIMKAEP